MARAVKVSSVAIEQSGPKSRVSRAEAVQRFLDVAIELVDTKPIAEISLQEIAVVAQLNHGYVFRYFGTRLDLFTAVADELANRSLAAANAEIEQRRTTREPFEPLDFSALSPMWTHAVKRIKVAQYLIVCGVDPARFAEKTREFTASIEKHLHVSGMNDRMSRALAVRASALLWTQVSVMDVLGITQEERDDVLALNLDQFIYHKATAKRLGWT